MLCAEMFAYCPGRNDDKCQHKRIAGHEEYEKKYIPVSFIWIFKILRALITALLHQEVAN